MCVCQFLHTAAKSAEGNEIRDKNRMFLYSESVLGASFFRTDKTVLFCSVTSD